MLAFHYVDMYWVVMPQFGPLKPAIMDLGTLLLVGGIFVAGIVVNMSQVCQRPVGVRYQAKGR